MKKTLPLNTARIQQETFVQTIDLHESIASTNDWALQICQQKEMPHLVLTLEQTAGRGRGNKNWWSSTGCLTFSLILNPEEYSIAPRDYPLLSLVTGLALYETFSKFVPQESLGVKWPNDIYLQNKKVSGLLIETVPLPRVVIGVGVNVNNKIENAPEELHSSAISLAEFTTDEIDMNDLLIHFLSQLEAELKAFPLATNEITRRWEMASILAEEKITIQDGNRLIKGFYNGIDTTGAIKLQTDSGIISISSGEIIDRETV
ncbi:Biotin operon repressor / Biotin--protein ligase [hydrothermal vent metagenome]|uniref:Biotin operon repressor / Biotin--protein ligase n=1 Tax=hydrothermal vent metagenome TaxID=652676 RepID=A0A3B1DZW3_9ZZZZ